METTKVKVKKKNQRWIEVYKITSVVDPETTWLVKVCGGVCSGTELEIDKTNPVKKKLFLVPGKKNQNKGTYIKDEFVYVYSAKNASPVGSNYVSGWVKASEIDLFNSYS